VNAEKDTRNKSAKARQGSEEGSVPRFDMATARARDHLPTSERMIENQSSGYMPVNPNFRFGPDLMLGIQVRMKEGLDEGLHSWGTRWEVKCVGKYTNHFWMLSCSMRGSFL